MPRKRNSDNWGLYDPRAPYNVSPVVKMDGTYRSKVTWSDGYVLWDNVVETRHSSIRPYYYTSPLTLIPGTSSFGRAPTNYVRRVYNQVTNTPLVFWRFGNKCESPIDTNEFQSTFGLVSQKSARFFDPNSSPYGDPDFENDLNRAVTECLLKLSENKVDVGVALAEAHKTVQGLATAGFDLWSTVKHLRKKEFKQLFNVLSKRSALHSRKIVVGKTAAQYWLEYQYAWKPLISEVYGLYQLLNEQLEPALLVHSNRSIKGRRNIEWQRIAADAWYAPRYSFHGSVKTQSTCRLTGRVNSDTLRALTRGLTNPLVVLWELVPYSFVVDWSIPVGNVLEAATATQGLTFVWGSTVQKYQSHGFVSMSPWVSSTYNVQVGEGEVMKFGMERKALSAFPRPVLYTKSPFSSSHLTSAVALFRQLV